MLNLSHFTFCPVDFQFIYPKGSDKSKFDDLDPLYVKINGIAINESGIKVCVRLFDEFKNFGLDKKSLTSKLCSDIIITGSGYISNDNNYNKVLNLDKYVFTGSYSLDYLIK